MKPIHITLIAAAALMLAGAMAPSRADMPPGTSHSTSVPGTVKLSTFQHAAETCTKKVCRKACNGTGPQGCIMVCEYQERPC